jgi:hypothetical protein
MLVPHFRNQMSPLQWFEYGTGLLVWSGQTTLLQRVQCGHAAIQELLLQPLLQFTSQVVLPQFSSPTVPVTEAIDASF